MAASIMGCVAISISNAASGVRPRYAGRTALILAANERLLNFQLKSRRLD
jgi:hypothetical protein